MDWLGTLIRNYLENVVLWQASPEDIATTAAVAAWIMSATQVVKRATEWLEGQEWVAKIPALAKVAEFLAHGWGPRIVAAAVAVATMAPTVVADGSLTGTEAINIVAAVASALGLYELLRGRLGWLFPKRDA